MTPTTTRATTTETNIIERNPMTLYRSLAVATVLGVLMLTTSCGSDGGDTDADTAQRDQPTDVPSGAPSGGPGLADVDFEAIQECLTAAGLDDVMPTDVPTDMPTDMPTDFPTDFPTDGTPPEGMPSGGPGGGMGALQDPEVQAALEACGIDLPQAPGAGQS
jgi:hypothetical protein